MNGRRWAHIVSIVLVLVMIGTSGYLFFRQMALSTGQPDSDICSIVFAASCDETLLSSSSSFLALPWAAWGSVYGSFLLALLGLGWFLDVGVRKSMLTTAVVANLGGLGVSGYLSWLLLSGAEPFCPLCVQTHLLNVALLPALMLARGGGVRAIAEDLRRGAAYLSGREAEDSSAVPMRTMALLSASLLALVAYQWLLLRAERVHSAQLGPSPSELRAAFWASTPRDIPVSDADPRFGRPGAAAELVVFSDFQCPACRENAKTLEKLADLYPSEVTIVFKQFPLSTTCNPLLEIDMHPEACELALLSLAAHREGKFWAFHRAVFDMDEPTASESIDAVITNLGLDPERIRAIAATDEVQAKLAADIQLATNLDVLETPYMFLNGRPIPGELRDQLLTLVRETAATRG